MRFKVALSAVVMVSTACGSIDESAFSDTSPSEVARSVESSSEAVDEPDIPDQLLREFEAGPAGAGWPRADEYEERWRAGVEPYRLLHCSNTELRMEDDSSAEELGPIMLMESDGDWVTVVDAVGGDRRLYPGPWDESAADGGTRVLATTDRTLRCLDADVEEVTAGDSIYGPFVYSVTLTSPEEPVRVENATELDEASRKRLDELRKGAWSVQAVQELIALEVPNSDGVWGNALAWAEREGHGELAYEIYRRYRPVGYCSRDTRPLTTKKSFAELCQKLERPRCHLALTTELLAYRVSRRSDMWIGGKPVTYQSELDLLPDAVDASLFMLGLLVDFPGTPGNETASISPRFFALATYGSEHADSLVRTIRSWLDQPGVDSWNRHRFAAALFFLRARLEPTVDATEHAAAVADLPGVPYVTRTQLLALD